MLHLRESVLCILGLPPLQFVVHFKRVIVNLCEFLLPKRLDALYGPQAVTVGNKERVKVELGIVCDAPDGNHRTRASLNECRHGFDDLF